MENPPGGTSGWLTHPAVWAAGLAGAMVALAHAPTGLTLRQRAVTLFTGVLTAGFVTPALADWWGLSMNLVALVGFLTGMAGMSLTAVVVNVAVKVREDPESALRWLAAVTGRTLPTPPANPGTSAPQNAGAPVAQPVPSPVSSPVQKQEPNSTPNNEKAGGT